MADVKDRDALRREARRRRRAAADTVTDASARLARHVLEAVPWTGHRVVAGYWPVGTEIDDRPLLAALSAEGLAVALPCVVAPGQPLVFRAWNDGDTLTDGAHDIPAPASSQPSVTPTLLVVPLLAYDDTGHRLGSGLGYYDRTLEKLRRDGSVVAVGVAYAAQRVADIDALPTDQPLDWIVTEEGAVQVA